MTVPMLDPVGSPLAEAHDNPHGAALTRPRPTLSHLFGAFFMIGLTGFDGVLPWARRMLVERRLWLTDREFTELLPLAQLLPGPNVSNIATILGRQYHGALGATAAVGGLYLAPTVFTFSLGYAYARWGDAPVTAHLLAGLMPVATGLVVATVAKLIASLPRDWRNATLVLATFIAIGVLKLPLLLVLAVLGPFGTWLMLRAMLTGRATRREE
ncbi:chromate transporter [Paraburkholderia sp. SIMBA_030]|uniref:chromate transporter n=1 Tax=Paraburkholderia sp. SIMBA_030 TaxID=3085773 RepID=UPI00397D23D3